MKSLHSLPIPKLQISQYLSPNFTFNSPQILAHDLNHILRKSPPEILAAAALQGVPSEQPQITNVSEFDTIPPEKPANPPPLSPGSTPGPELPRPSPPSQDGPGPSPPHGQDVTPPKPPEPIDPDIVPTIMGSDGLVFY